MEILCVEIIRPCIMPFLVVTWYRPPGSDTRLFDELENFLSIELHTRRLQFLSCVYQLEPINEPTRATRTSATQIDLIFSNRNENIVKSGVIPFGISDCQ